MRYAYPYQLLAQPEGGFTVTFPEAVRRLRDPLHQSRINQVDAALRALGKRVGIVVEAA